MLFHRDVAGQDMIIHVLRNLMLAGGLLHIVHFGAGAFRLDARRLRPNTADLTPLLVRQPGQDSPADPESIYPTP